MLQNYNLYGLLNYFLLKSEEINEGEPFLPQLYSSCNGRPQHKILWTSTLFLVKFKAGFKLL